MSGPDLAALLKEILELRVRLDLLQDQARELGLGAPEAERTAEVEAYLRRTSPDQVEADQVRLVLEAVEWNIAAASRRLKVTRRTIYQRLKRLKITRRHVDRSSPTRAA